MYLLAKSTRDNKAKLANENAKRNVFFAILTYADPNAHVSTTDSLVQKITDGCFFLLLILN